tara:strand:+ start:1888 stop:2094 length:207 start_codon:yes stop_codon:yes gene_type:complete
LYFNILNKVIIPVAGIGTRMLPVTKAISKEILPIINKPIIQYIVEEAVFSAFKDKKLKKELIKRLNTN